jgi:voltage-dependent calcium channel R type alpha-1E
MEEPDQEEIAGEFVGDQKLSFINSNNADAQRSLRSSESARRKAKYKRNQSISLMHYEEMDSKSQSKKDSGFTLKDKLIGRSMFIFGPENRIRVFANLVYSHPYFDRFILFLISISTLTLAFESPLENPKGTTVTVLTYIDYVMSSFFFCECITKVIALGFIGCGSSSYIRNPWNILDFIIVVSSLASMVFVNVDLKAIKSLRILRVLRPLRIVAKNRGLKLAITSLFNSLPNIANLLLIVVFFIFLLAILCMTLFSGKFAHCETEHLPISHRQAEELILNLQNCLDYGGEWVRPDFHFDTTPDAMITLLSIQTTEGWIDVMWAMVDGVGQYKVPKIMNNPSYIIFCMSIMIFITLLFLNLFVGVVIETFNKEKEALSLNSLLRSIERKWIDVQIMTYQAKPRIKFNSTGRRLRDTMIRIATHPKFDQFIMLMILSNTIVLAIKWYAMP